MSTEAALRPEKLEDFLGQNPLRERLEIILSQTGRERLGTHILLTGPAGYGKTSLAKIVANELSVPLQIGFGPALRNPALLAALLVPLKTPSVVFVDEVHRLPTAVEEMLYPALEDNMLHIESETRTGAAVVRKLPLLPFLMVAATTRPGLLTKPLRDRFGFEGRLEPYKQPDLAAIADRSARLLGLSLSPEAAAEVAARSRATPRLVNRLLQRVKEWAAFHNAGYKLDVQQVSGALNTFGVDTAGLEDQHRRALRVLARSTRPLGLETWAVMVDEQPDTLERVLEPELIRAGMAERTSKGRVITEMGRVHLDHPFGGLL